MSPERWPEAANRRLRALLWKGCGVGEAAVALGRSLSDVDAQIRRLRIATRRQDRAALAD